MPGNEVPVAWLLWGCFHFRLRLLAAVRGAFGVPRRRQCGSPPRHVVRPSALPADFAYPPLGSPKGRPSRCKCTKNFHMSLALGDCINAKCDERLYGRDVTNVCWAFDAKLNMGREKFPFRRITCEAFTPEDMRKVVQLAEAFSQKNVGKDCGQLERHYARSMWKGLWELERLTPRGNGALRYNTHQLLEHNTAVPGAVVVQWLDYPPPAWANRVRFPAGLLPHMENVPDDATGRGVFSGISRFPRLLIPALYILTSIAPVGSQALMFTRRPNLFTSPTSVRLRCESDLELVAGVCDLRVGTRADWPGGTFPGGKSPYNTDVCVTRKISSISVDMGLTKQVWLPSAMWMSTALLACHKWCACQVPCGCHQYSWFVTTCVSATCTVDIARSLDLSQHVCLLRALCTSSAPLACGINSACNKPCECHQHLWPLTTGGSSTSSADGTSTLGLSHVMCLPRDLWHRQHSWPVTTWCLPCTIG
ncbi:hypothetical protein PR048_029769 [Dryococelus australis]|uniref:Uncharacterized protein n=1 Tax=Dryococelus australis TaxID=614101 RepID=A0ABQ9G727_9NEOP|nr:hypothetical protein PR048_029769 [Dryococelus australis]